jgi:polar amino acid transport system substrate-binding protein
MTTSEHHAAAAQLIPSGVLRVGVVEAPRAGVFFVARSAPGGAPSGVTVALGAALAHELGVPVEYAVFPNSGACTEALSTAAIEVGFMPVDATRREKVAFGPAYYLLESTYMVSHASGITTLADVDAPHVRVVGIANTTTIRAAARTLSHTAPLPCESVELALAALREGRADALALSRDSLQALLADVPGARLVAGGFQRTGIAIAVPPGRPAALAYASAFLEQAKASGLVRRCFDAAGLADEAVAGAAT